MIETRRCESPLGTWTSCGWEPPAGDALCGLVDRIWDFDGVLAFAREQTFPDGKLALVIQLDEPHRPVLAVDVDANAELARAGDPFPAICFDGIRTGTATVEAPRNRCRVIGIVLRPLGASALLGTSLRALTDLSVDLHAILGSAAHEIAQRLSDARDGSERVRRARAWTEARLMAAPEPVPVVARVLEHIERGAGNVAITQIEDLAGRSRSRLCAAFADLVGLSPKRYARVIRFRNALELVRASERSLGDVALRTGYYDQAHMNAEFQEHAGLTPSAYRTALRFPKSTHLAL